MEEVVEEIQRDGTFDWAPTSNSPFMSVMMRKSCPTSLPRIYLDEPSNRYGSPEEREARARAREAIEELRRAFRTAAHNRHRHNRPPPEEAAEPDEIIEFRLALEELAESGQAPATIALVKRWQRRTRCADYEFQWGLKKLDKVVDASLPAAFCGSLHNTASNCRKRLMHRRLAGYRGEAVLLSDVSLVRTVFYATAEQKIHQDRIGMTSHMW